jgi:hypothetical protein
MGLLVRIRCVTESALSWLDREPLIDLIYHCDSSRYAATAGT